MYSLASGSLKPTQPGSELPLHDWTKCGATCVAPRIELGLISNDSQSYHCWQQSQTGQINLPPTRMSGNLVATLVARY